MQESTAHSPLHSPLHAPLHATLHAPPPAREAAMSLRGVTIGYGRPIVEEIDLDVLRG